MVVVKDVYASDALLVKASYHYKGEYNIPMRKLYGKKGEFEIYLHLYEEGNHHIALHQTFRDYLIKQPQARAAYAQLKQAIIDHDASHTKLSTTSITYYNLKKHAFIASIIEASGFTGLCIRLCSHHEEWISYHALLQQALVKKQLSHCVYQDNLSNPDYKNIVLYKGHQIIGAVQVHVNSLKACLHFCEIDKSIPVEERQELQAFLQQQIAKWVKSAFHVNDFTACIDSAEGKMSAACGDNIITPHQM
jgi:hypothetical protein